jgi:KUP system potassium uptake protein
VIVLVLGFRSSASLASAYGVAVTGTFILNTILFLVVARSLWEKPKWMVAAGGAVLLTVEVTFFAANLTKIAHGGWLPLLVAGVVFTVLMTWQRGRVIVTHNRTLQEGSLQTFVAALHDMTPPIQRVSGTAVFLNAAVDTTPLALRANVEHNHVLQDKVIILCIHTDNIPHVPESERLTLHNLDFRDDHVTQLVARFGFQDQPDVPATLRCAIEQDLVEPNALDEVSYFLSRITIVRGSNDEMPRWQKRLFLTISHNASNPVEYFALPIERCISMGGQVEV